MSPSLHRQSAQDIQMTIELKKLVGGGNFKELCKFVFLKMKIIVLIKPVVGKGFVHLIVSLKVTLVKRAARNRRPVSLHHS